MRSSHLISLAIIALSTVNVSVGYGGPFYAGPPFSSMGGVLLGSAPASAGSAPSAIGYCNVPIYDSRDHSLGTRVVRWDANQTVTLGVLGVDNFGYGAATLRGTNRLGAAIAIGDAIVNHQILGTRAMRWAPGATEPQELGLIWTNPNQEVYADPKSINDAGEVVGGEDHPGEVVPVYWNPAGLGKQLAFTPTTDMTTTGQVSANSISDSSMIAGERRFSRDGGVTVSRVIRWDSPTSPGVELQNLGVGDGGAELAVEVVITRQGTTFGTSTKYAAGVNVGQRPVKWVANETVPVELGVLGTDVNGLVNLCEITDANDSDIAIGQIRKYSATGRESVIAAVRWTQDGTVHELQRLGNRTDGPTNANAINNLGVIAGSDDSSGSAQAVIWDSEGIPHDLNAEFARPAGWVTLSAAMTLSDTGWVTGLGTYDADGVDTGQHGFTKAFLMLVPRAGTYGRGDANFDTVVNFTDLVILAQHYNQSNSTQDVNVGDFDLNGVTNFQDLVTLAQHYGSGASLSVISSGDPSLAGAASPGFASDWALAQSLVPEPASMMTALGAAVVGWTSRRRRA